MTPGLQKITPQHLVSRLAGCFANCRYPHLKNWMIKRYIKHFKVDMSEATQSDYTQYPTFNDFFIRSLKKEFRPVDMATDSIICPVDGGVSELGVITNDRLIQAKNKDYDLRSLLGGEESLSKEFLHGHFATLYLAPKDYHRIHMPIAGKLLEMLHIPGKLFSVSPQTVDGIPQLFARNERVICIFDTVLGKMAIIAVGAIIVGSIATTWHGIVTPPTGKIMSRWNYQNQSIQFSKGDEMGHFQIGSTVIVLFPANKIKWHTSLHAGSAIKMGQGIAKFDKIFSGMK